MVKSGCQTSPQDMEIVAGLLSTFLILSLIILVQYEDWYEIGVNVKRQTSINARPYFDSKVFKIPCEGFYYSIR